MYTGYKLISLPGVIPYIQVLLYNNLLLKRTITNTNEVAYCAPATNIVLGSKYILST